MQHKYLFILSPPYSGSTVLWQLLQTSASVSALPDEGQKLPELREMMRTEPWSPQREFDWQFIHRVWHSYWDPGKPVFLEKSPPHLCRPEKLVQYFSPGHFILLMRDPVAICEALVRRNHLAWDAAARRWLEWLGLYLNCVNTLPHSFQVCYEDLVRQPAAVFDALGQWLPELGDVDYRTRVLAHAIDGQQWRGLVDMNPQKEAQVPTAARTAIRRELNRDDAARMLRRTPYAERYLD